LTAENRDEILAENQAKGKQAGTDYRANKERLTTIEEELGQQKHRLHLLQNDLAEMGKLRQKEVDLAARVAALEAEQERLAEWVEQAKDLDSTLATMKEKTADLEHQVRNAEQVALIVKDLQAKVNQLNEDASWARRRVGAAQQKLDHCAFVEKEKARKLEEQRKAQDQASIYEELRVAFGKKGIQAMIIEAAIPEIEEGANRLLSRMTDGQMSVALNSQRETQKGDTVETLDIEVADEMGARDYALFSGGERFRINFAVRIAISQLLARRAGAQLQTLIIDEGFGTQDASGRERLVEAISSVQGDFARVLAITHIDELRDAFPNRIEVVKGPAGSVISVN
jgi:exonuclease SbcC